jgi:hypothetical protein
MKWKCPDIKLIDVPENTCLLQIFSRQMERKPSGVARQLVTILASPRKVTKRRRSPVYRPCGVPSKNHNQAGLRNSHYVLRQSSPTPPHDYDFSRRRTGEGRSKAVCAPRTPNQKKQNRVGFRPHSTFNFIEAIFDLRF